MFFYKHLPLINCLIAGTALTFQVTVLNPWHKNISKQIEKIQSQLDKIGEK